MVFDGQPFFVRIDGRVWVAPEDVPEDSQCTAMTKRRKRCSNPLDYGQTNGYSYLKIDGGYVEGFDYNDNNGTLNERGGATWSSAASCTLTPMRRAPLSWSGCRSSRLSTLDTS